MNFNNISFPHPVLGISDDIASKINFTSKITANKDSYLITIKFSHDNENLQNLINEGKAEFVCESTCSNTLYRDITKHSDGKMEMRIPRKKVKGRVDFVCLLLAKEIIPSYSNLKSHNDYDGYVFDINKGEVLAYFGEFHFNADIKYEKLKAVSAFMDVVAKKDIEFTNIDLKKNKIEIQLPENDFAVFSSESISKQPMFSSIFHSSIVLNALLIALYGFEEHKTEQWARVIDYRLKNEEEFQSLPIADKENIPEIAQRLLGNPFQRLLNCLEIILDTTENEY